MALQFGVGE